MMKRLYQAQKKEIGCCGVTYKGQLENNLGVACIFVNREPEVIVIISGVRRRTIIVCLQY